MSLQSHLAVMRNAFSTATTAPKVPDGKVSSSVGQRNASSFTLNSAEGKITIALTPSLAVPMLHCIESAVTQAKLNCVINNPELCFKAPSKTPAGVFSGNKDISALDRFRVVSQGLRLTPINNSESNNGWFEAIRVIQSYDRKNLTAYVSTASGSSTGSPQTGDANQMTDANTAAATGGFSIGVASEDSLIATVNWANHPSYVTGKLRDIGKHLFSLQTVSDRELLPLTDDLTSGHLGIDTSFDTIYVRIHSTPSNDLGTQTAIHVHMVQNVEGTYDASSPMSRYHSSSFSAPGAVINTNRSINRDCKASTIRAQTSYYGR